MRFLNPATALTTFLLPLLCARPYVEALQLDPTSPDSIKDVSSQVARQLVARYATKDDKGVYHYLGGWPGVLYLPYYWWQVGGMLGTLLDYWHYTGDDQYNGLIRESLIYQFGDNNDLLPRNASTNEGNDDQAFWAFSMMSAAEYNLPDPPADKPGWLSMAQSVFNQFVTRYEKEVADDICGGGLRWQIQFILKGWWYKNTSSNGGFFQLSARLAVYTKNDTYASWAEKVFDWMANSPLLEADGTVNDGTDAQNTDPPCKDADHTPWTYTYGIMIGGAAYMYNYTNGAEKWKTVLTNLLNKTEQFYPKDKGSVMFEACEPWADEEQEINTKGCDADQQSFKTYLARWLGVTVQMAPFTHDLIMPRLQHSAVRAAQTCEGPSMNDGGPHQCGLKWYVDGFDGVGTIGAQMAALNIISVLNVDHVLPPLSNNTGGTSHGDPGLGTEVDDFLGRQVAMRDKVGAAALTMFAVALIVGGGWWMIA